LGVLILVEIGSKWLPSEKYASSALTGVVKTTKSKRDNMEAYIK